MPPHLIGRFITQVGLRLAFHVPRRRALLIGIRSAVHIKRSETFTSIGSAESLQGSHDDVNALKALLFTLGYKSSDVVILMDDGMEDRLQPTHVNIMRELDNFTVDQRPGDIFFFGYSGHSYHTRPRAGITPRIHWIPVRSFSVFSILVLICTDIIPIDGEDCLNKIPDYSKVIFAEVLKQKLVKSLLSGSRLIAVLDTCHSASLLNLPHCKCNRIASWGSLLRRTVRRTRELFQADNIEVLSPGPVLARSGSCLSSVLSDQLKKLRCSGYCPRPWTPIIPVLCISACKDSQEVFEDWEGKSLTRTFIDVFYDNRRPSLTQLMRACTRKSELPNCTPWHPQLSSLVPLNMRTILSL
ncbi:caspase domain-containing protein [Mycena leptocephala]|nr:caspase domain-containing protein [Mycena leptocephala]